MEDANTQKDAVVTEGALEACLLDLAQSREKLQYLVADFDNYRRRTEKEKVQWSHYAQETVLRDLLAIVDDFDRSAGELASNVGFELIYKSCKKTLAKYGVEEMTQVITFDPTMHEAIMSVAAEGKAAGTIMQVFQKGYMFKGAVLRPAQVSVVQ